nr:hypothetical protein [Chloroflexia bacterium]
GYADVTAFDHAVQIVEHREVSADPLTSFRDWERLRTMAIEVLDNQLAELRALAEADYKRTGPSRQTRSLKSDLEMIPNIRDALLASPRFEMPKRSRPRSQSGYAGSAASSISTR